MIIYQAYLRYVTGEIWFLVGGILMKRWIDWNTSTSGVASNRPLLLEKIMEPCHRLLYKSRKSAPWKKIGNVLSMKEY